MSDNPTKPKLTVGSLFAGIGGFDLGFERAGFETVWQVEIDDYCRRVLERHFPRADRSVTDVQTAGAHNLRPVDVVSGGFPCQDVSHAGRRYGIDGSRSGLWKHMRRIVCELRPQVVIVENVSGLLDRGMDRVLGEMAADGFDAEWSVLPACAYGAPHTRQRVFIVAYAQSERPGQLRWLQCEKDSTPQRNLHWAKHEPECERVAHGIPGRLERLTAIGNSVSPIVAQWIAERTKESLTREVTTEHG